MAIYVYIYYLDYIYIYVFLYAYMLRWTYCLLIAAFIVRLRSTQVQLKGTGSHREPFFCFEYCTCTCFDILYT